MSGATLIARHEAEVASRLFRSLADPTRLSVLLCLMHGEHRVTDLVEHLGCSQSNVSAHLACLKDCGLVADQPEGRAVRYRLASKAMVDLLRGAERVLDETGHAIALCPGYPPAPTPSAG